MSTAASLLRTRIVCDNVSFHANPFHFHVQFVALFPEIAASTGRNGAVENVHIRRDTFLFHAFHELKSNVRSRTLLHARHGGPKDDNVLGDTHFCHLVEELEALSVLKACVRNKSALFVSCKSNRFPLPIIFFAQNRGAHLYRKH